MVEKRPHPGNHGVANGAKLAKTNATASPGGAANAIAAARAKAEAKAREIQAKLAASRGAGTNGASPTPPPVSGAPGGDAASRLAAMKARLAGLTASSAPAVPAPKDDSASPSTETGAQRFATTLGNRRLASPAVDAKGKSLVQKTEEKPENPYFDPKANITARGRMSRGLLFNEHGKYLDQASKLRAQSRLEQIKAKLAQQARRAGLDENSERGFLVQAPPAVEWWDEGLLAEPAYDCIDDTSKVKIDNADSIITIYIQHPVLLKAPQDQRLIETKPMYLTSKEQAKLRRMRRAADLKEHQAKIRLGLEPPPPPKVKRGNMMRVMGEQAIADPTAVEMLVEAQIQERYDNHVKANEERKLTKEQRHAKLAQNQQKDAQKGLYMCVFKINTLAFGKHRYQIDINAKQHDLTGITIFHPQMNLVVVEGGIHSIQAYKKLMLHRIKWTENAKPTEIQNEKQASDPQWMKSVDLQGHVKDHSFNKCLLVFEGELKQKAFRKWGSRMCETDGEAREVLSRSKLDSLWALAKSTTE